MSEIPSELAVVRASAFDLKQKLSILGRYPSTLAFPDRWNSWVVSGVRDGMEIIQKEKPNAIFSTFPIATAHWIGLRLKRRTGLPWVADFRDSMTEENYPKERVRRFALRRFEKSVIKCADRVIFTAPGCREMYAKRYPEIENEKWQIVQNGFDESVFSEVASSSGFSTVENGNGMDRSGRRKLLLHSGILYPEERDPSAFLGALSDLKKADPDLRQKLQVRFRATGHDEQIGRLVREHCVEDIVDLAPGVAYSDALAEMVQADALLILQAGNCNHQIPAKIYEYLRTGLPIVALTDPRGDTATVLSERGFASSVVDITDRSSIYEMLKKFKSVGLKSTVPSGYDASVDTRIERAKNVAGILNDLC